MAFSMEQRRAWRHTPRGAFSKQKERAKQRGIEWLLSFDEWWRLWEPMWAFRGRLADKYVMARHGDKGPYAIGNVKIITFSDNCREREEILR